MRSLGYYLGVVAMAGLLFVLVGWRTSTDSAPAPVKAAMPGSASTRNLVNLTDKKMPLTWDVKAGQEKNVKWSAALGSRAYGRPVVAGGKVYVGTNNNVPRNKDVLGDRGVLMCFRASDGTFLWQALHDKLPAGRVNDWPEVGICSTPAVEGKRLWYVSNRGEVICASTEGLGAGNLGVKDEKYRSPIDADIIWRLDMIKELGVFPHCASVCSPLLVGDLLYVVTGNGVDAGHIILPSPRAPSFLAINKNTGKVVWQSNAPGPNILHGQWSSPAYASVAGRGQVIFPGGDGWLYAFEPKVGRLLWKFNCNPRGAVWRLVRSTKSYFIGMPVVWENKLYIGLGQDPEQKEGLGRLWCIDLVKALAKGATNPDNDVSPFSPVKGDDPPFDPRDKRNANSALLWHYGGRAPAGAPRPYLFGWTLSTCAVHDGLCYAADYGGQLYCFDARTGKKFWEHDLGADTWSSPYWVDGKVYIANERGEVHIFEHGRKRKLVRKVKMGPLSMKVRTPPVAADGVLYIVTVNPCKLWAITAR